LEADQKEQYLARQGRIAAVVVAVAMFVWVALQWAAPAIGLSGRFAFLFDLAALAAFVWAFVVAWQVWRARRQYR